MTTQERREAIKEVIKQSKTAISASTLAKKFNVSRQIVVGDIALLRAAQEEIIATPRGYIYQHKPNKNTYVIACQHDDDTTQEELETIVDMGASIENVIVSHPVYGELIGTLHIESRLDVQEFVNKRKSTDAKNLSAISGGLHLHTIVCKSEEHFNTVVQALQEKGYVYQK